MNTPIGKNLRNILFIGLISGIVAIYLCLTGLVENFTTRSLVKDLLSLGTVLLFLPMLSAGYIYAKQTAASGTGRKTLGTLLAAALTGLIVSGVLALLVWLGQEVDLREVFINASPTLYGLIMFGREGLSGIWILLLSGAVLGAAGAGLYLLPARFKQPLILATVSVVVAGLFSGLISVLLIARGGAPAALSRFLFSQVGLTQAGAVIVFALMVAVSIFRSRPKKTKVVDTSPKGLKLTQRRKWILMGVAAAVALLLPLVSGGFIAQVIVLISLYTLMALGLNITLGFAGLLDLGFVAFFAIGAYVMALLTSYGPLGVANLSFWAALPIAVVTATIAGAVLGLPVLGIRGDYLAIATLGFGEIVRLLAGSDFLGRWLGGPQGIVGIQKPCIGFLGPELGIGVTRICNGVELGTPTEIYYLAVIAAILIAFVALRLRDSRLGRAWMAIREDEDVAEAMGINLIRTKLLAYMMGASFAGLGGAIFAALVGSIFASSMQLTVSINVVAIIIVGGMGSIPGVVVGALALIGLPELFREFSEYRFLFYGMALIAMMLAKPEGLWPSQTVSRELHKEEDVVPKTELAAKPAAE